MPIVDPRVVRFILPSAIAVGDVQLYILALLYFITAIACVATLVMSWRKLPKTRVFSFKTTFLGFSTIFMLYRTIVALFNITWELYWLLFAGTFFPLLLQFTTFSILILFLARRLMIVQGNEQYIKWRLYPIYLAVVGVFWIVGIVTCSLVVRSLDGLNRDNFDASISIYIALALGLVVSCASSWVLATISPTERKQELVHRYMIIVSIYLGAFMTRTIWNFLTFLNLNKLQELFYFLHHQHNPLGWTIYWTYFLCVEISPILIIVALLAWKMRGDLKRKSKTLPAPIAPRETSSLLGVGDDDETINRV